MLTALVCIGVGIVGAIVMGCVAVVQVERAIRDLGTDE